MKPRSRVHVLLVALILAASATPVAADETPSTTAPEALTPANGVVAYYFHGNLRCATCRKLEAYSEEAITQGFPDDLAAGRLTWRVVNTDEAEHKHFVEDFQLVTKSLVLVAYQDGEVVRSENLSKVWQLVRNRETFLEYVRDATREFLGSS
jgi:hypothetical protein